MMNKIYTRFFGDLCALVVVCVATVHMVWIDSVGNEVPGGCIVTFYETQLLLMWIGSRSLQRSLMGQYRLSDLIKNLNFHVSNFQRNPSQRAQRAQRPPRRRFRVLLRLNRGIRNSLQWGTGRRNIFSMLSQVKLIFTRFGREKTPFSSNFEKRFYCRTTYKNSIPVCCFV